MPPQEQTNQNNVKSNSHTKLYALIAAVFIVLIAVALVIIYNNRNRGNSNSPNNAYQFTYNNLTPFEITAPNNAGMSFDKPDAIGGGDKQPQTSSSVLSLFQKDSKSAVNIAQITAWSFANGVSFQKNLKQPLSSQSLNDNQSNAYRLYMTPATQLISGGLDLTYGLALEPAKDFTNSNIKSKAWEIDFSASSVKKNSSRPDMKGRLLFVMGKNAGYYLLIDMVSGNWDSNQQTIQKITNSLKVDI